MTPAMNDPPTLAEQIRRYALDSYVRPARRTGERAVSIRAGEVHRDLGLTNRVPAVCGALGSAQFEGLAGVTLIERVGPAQSTTTQFRYRLEPHTGEARRHRGLLTAQATPRPVKTKGPWGSWTTPAGTAKPDPASGRPLYLVSCVKTKLPRPAKAKDLYVSDWFRKARAYVEREDTAWRILSAKYGLVDPEEVIRPYEKTLITMRKAERRAWAGEVLAALERRLADADAVVFLAGARYREFIEPWLTSRGVRVDVPMRGLSQGRQLAWLGARLHG